MKEDWLIGLSIVIISIALPLIPCLVSKAYRNTMGRCLEEDAKRRKRKKDRRRKVHDLETESYRRFGPFRNFKRMEWLEKEEEKEYRRMMKGKF